MPHIPHWLDLVHFFARRIQRPQPGYMDIPPRLSSEMRRRLLEQVMPAALISTPVFVAVALLLSLALENLGASQLVAATFSYGTLMMPGLAVVTTDAMLRWRQFKGCNLVTLARVDSRFREFTQTCSLIAYATSFAAAAILSIVWPNLFIP